MPSVAGDLTADSRKEQAGAGLDRLSREDAARPARSAPPAWRDAAADRKAGGAGMTYAHSIHRLIHSP